MKQAILIPFLFGYLSLAAYILYLVWEKPKKKPMIFGGWYICGRCSTTVKNGEVCICFDWAKVFKKDAEIFNKESLNKDTEEMMNEDNNS